MKKNLFPIIVLSGAAVMSSCVDNDYDLENVNLLLGTNSEITLPTSSTGDIVLKSLMNLKEDGVVQTIADPEGGDDIFVVSESGSANVKPVTIKAISFKKPTLGAINVNIERADVASSAKKRKVISVNIPIGGQTISQTFEVPSESYSYKIKETDNTDFKLSSSEATGIDGDVTDIEYAKVSGAEVKVDLSKIAFNNAPQIKYIHMDDFQASVPKGLHVSKATFTYNGVSHSATVDNENGLITLIKGNSDKISISQPIELNVTIDELITGQDIVFSTDGKSGKVSLNGKFRLDGQFRVETSEMDESVVQQKIDALTSSQIQSMYDFQTGKFNLDMDKIGLIPNKIIINGNASFQNDINITSVTGSIRHEMPEVDPIKLDDMPDFLSDDDVILDLENPLVFISVENEFPAEAVTDVTLSSSYTDSKKESVVRSTGNITCKKGTNNFMLADHNTTVRPSKYTDAQYIQVSDLGGLIRHIPNQIDVDIQSIEARATDLKIPGTYNIGVNYEVYAPLTFGKQFQLVYQDTERDWAKDMDDMDKVDAEYINIEGQIDSDIPAEITFNIEPIDKECKVISQLETVSIAVPASAKNNKFTTAIKPTTGHTLNDAFTGNNGVKQLDGIRYKAVIKDATTGETLRSTAKIRLHDIKITLGKATYDAN